QVPVTLCAAGLSGIISDISVPPHPAMTLDRHLSAPDRPVAWHHICHPSRRQDTACEHLRQGYPGCARGAPPGRRRHRRTPLALAPATTAGVRRGRRSSTTTLGRCRIETIHERDPPGARSGLRPATWSRARYWRHDCHGAVPDEAAGPHVQRCDVHCGAWAPVRAIHPVVPEDGSAVGLTVREGV